MGRALLLLVVSCSLFACETKLVVGQRNDAAGDDAGAAGAQCTDSGSIPAETDPIALPWSTGFENGFCDYEASGGFCIGGGTRKTVTSPTAQFGQFAAAFSVDSADTASNQARCVRQGVLPEEAYYGAWYYIPAPATLIDNSSLWNLWHFQGGDASQKGLWDISLINGDSGALELLVYDFLTPVVRKQTAMRAIPIPIGSWFHIEFFLKRRSDATGEIRLYQDGQKIIEATDLITDDSSWGQWYVGNISKGLTPADSTLYVDDVTIDTKLLP
ncbi:MAG: heparin lyase I family protein [Pseudomonadota bacterium]